MQENIHNNICIYIKHENEQNKKDFEDDYNKKFLKNLRTSKVLIVYLDFLLNNEIDVFYKKI